MDTTITAISKFAPEDISMDFERLRTEGITHLEDLATYIWTDFNAHDPGITILEVLCYAITDLGYRANLPIEDILASSGGSLEASFFPARAVLPVCPVTQNDYRKLLIDFPGVRNAWVERVYPDDVELWLQKTIRDLPDDFTFIDDNVALLDRLLENQYYERTFDLAPTQLQEILKKYELTDEDISIDDFTNVLSVIKLAANFGKSEKLDALEALINEVLCQHSHFEVSMTQETDYQKICLNGLYRICIDTHQDIEPGSKAARKLIEKIRKGYTDDSTKKYYKGLNEYRNLGEDVHDIQIASNQKINLCLDISVVEDADEEEVMAEVIFRLQEFFTPSVKFYTLRQLLEKGRSCDEIFNGPLLCNGFIDDEELEQAVLPKRIRLSDLYKIILDTPQVLTVNSLKTALFQEGDGNPIFEEKWCFPGQDFGSVNGCPIKPIIELRKSNLHVVKNGISTIIKENDIVDRISLLRLASQDLVGNASNQVEIPTGTFRPDLADYLSVQYEFPYSYTVGDNGVPDQASPLRKAQAKQLQAYLLFFDRLLGDYLKQLSQVRDLLSVQQDAESATYFYQSLYHVPGIRELINDPALDNIQSEDEWNTYQNENNHYISKLKQIVETPDMRFNRKHRILNHLLARFGEQFTAYATQIFKTRQHHLASKADFLKALPKLGLERAKAYNYKGKRILRKFEEKVKKSVKKIASEIKYEGLNTTRIEIVEERLNQKGLDVSIASMLDNLAVNLPEDIKRKVLKLKGQILDYFEPPISYEPDVWAESKNVAGLKKRIYKLLGWGDATTESVFNNPGYRIDEERDTNENFPRYYLVLHKLNEESRAEERLLVSEKAYTRRKINAFVTQLKIWINNVGTNDTYYDVVPDEENTSSYRVEFRAPGIDNGEDVVLQSTYRSEEEARLLLARIKELVYLELKNNFHLLEHILLRPNDPEDALLKMTYTCDLQFCPVDPYSFWISILVPAWKGQFQEVEYRNYFMQLVRRETPAHLALCFRWVNSEDTMENLEHALEQWREALAECTVDECDVTEKAKNLVDILNNLPCDCYCFSAKNTSPKC